MATDAPITEAAPVTPPPERRRVAIVRTRPDLIGLVVVSLLAALLPFGLHNASALGVLAVMFIWIGVNASWNVVLGYAGILSFGQLAFFSCGGYASAIISVHWHGGPVLDTLGGAAGGGVAALLVGLALMRLRGVYVALVTLAFHELLYTLIINDFSGFSGGPSGLGPIPPYIASNDLLVQSAIGYWIGLAGALVVVILALALIRSPIGLAIAASRDAEQVARARGVRVDRYRTVAFVFSGAMAGFMGALYGHYNTVMSPQVFDFGILMMLLSMLIIGGWGTVWGPIVGTCVLTGVTYWVQGAWPGYEALVTACLLVLGILFLRGGLVGGAERTLTRIRQRLRGAGPTAAAHEGAAP